MYRPLLTVALVAGLAASPAAVLAQDARPTKTMQQADLQFVREAAGGGMAEVELGRLAAGTATNPNVKKFGQMMVDDHSKANQQLAQLAKQKKLEVPATLPPDAKAAKERLSQLSGMEFDRAFMRQMLNDHQKTIALFQRQAESGEDPELRQLAKQTLPVLQQHLELAQQIDSQMSGTPGTGTERQRADRTHSH